MVNINELKRLSPVPVSFMDVMTHRQFSGAYYSIKYCSGKPCIEIRKDLTNGQKIITLIHEVGHALCDSEGCKCMSNPDHTQREIHANKFVLRRLMKYKLKKEIKVEMVQIEKQANGLTNYIYYKTAAKHIMKLKLWQKCLNYLE